MSHVCIRKSVSICIRENVSICTRENFHMLSVSSHIKWKNNNKSKDQLGRYHLKCDFLYLQTASGYEADFI